MSWAYWGIVIGLSAMIVMLIACIRLLSFDGNEDRQESTHDASGSSDMTPEPPTIHKKAA
jgi:hypothetical protein